MKEVLRAAALGCLVFAAVLSPLTLHAVTTVTRGPYLQQGGTNSIVVRWRTSVAATTVMRYGTAPGNFTAIFSNAAVVIDHIVPLTGLQPDTKYFYEVGTTTGWFVGDTNDFFVTSPPIGTRKPTRIWVLGDSGYPGAPANAVRDAYSSFTGDRPTDLWLMLGDNAYESGTDAEHQTAVFNTYPTFLQNSVLWPTLGNHEIKSTDSSGQPPYFAIFTLPQNAEAGGVASGTEKYYSFDYANIHFVCLDSMTSDRRATGPMCNWLRADLAATTQEWLIAFFHHPPYSKGSHDSDSDIESVEMRQNVLPILEGEGVDLVLCGHSHSYERSFLLDGHYGSSSTLTASMKKDAGNGRTNGSGAYMKSPGAGNQGAIYSVAGSSSEAHGGNLDHPAMFTSLNVLGSLVIDVSSNRLDYLFLTSDRTAGDWFTILKQPPPPSITSSPASMDVLLGSNAVLSVSATGGLPLDYYWLKDGMPLDVPDSSVLSINNAQLSDSGLYRAVVSNTWGTATSAVAVLTVLTNVDPISLPEALDTVNLTWITTNSSAWQGQYILSHDGADAARSGSISNNATTSAQTTVNGPGILSFWWKVSSETNADYLILSFNSSEQARISGEVDWTQRTINVPSGSQLLRWSYTKNGSGTAGQDRAWLDQVQFTPLPVVITNQPVARSVDAGATVTFSVGAAGTPPFAYQWQRNGSPLSDGGTVRGSTTATLTLSNVQPAQAGSYSVLVSNLVGGAASSNALLNVTPVILLAEALDGTNLVWTTNGTPPWTGQSLVTHDGVDAARSGAIGDSATTYIQTTVNGPGTVTFWWKVSSQPSSDTLQFAIGGSERARLSGEMDWRKTNFSVATGSQLLRWTYSKNSSTVAGQDRAWVDQVVFERLPSPAAPLNLTATPVSISRIDLAWTDASTNESAFLVERSTNGTTFTQVASLASNVTTYASTGLLASTVYQYRVRATNVAGASAYSAPIVASSTLPFTSARINFQPASAPVFPGYLVDGGLVYGDRANGLIYGWNSSRTSSASDRNSSRSPDQRYDTFITTSSSTRWELAVPNGNYNVLLVAGDASSSSGTYRYGVEGVVLLNGVANSSSRWVSGRTNITVSDGRLTLTNVPGVSSVPLCFIEVVKFVPILICQPNKSVECGSAWDFNPPTAASDPCGASNIAVVVAGTITNAAGICGFTATRTWRAVDGCGNTNVCSQTVSVVDTTPPALICVPNKITDSGSGWTFDAPTVLRDDCSGTNVRLAILSTTTNRAGFCEGTFAVTQTWSAIDLCGNSNTCAQTVTVIDTTPPTLVCAPDKYVEAGVDWSFDAPALPTDLASGTNVTLAILSTTTNGIGYCEGTFAVTQTWSIIDPCGNSNTCTQTVTVIDTTPPTFVCAPDKSVEAGADWSFDAPAAPADLVSGTNVALAILSTTTNGIGFCAGTFAVTQIWSATDPCGNSNTCAQTVTVIDTTAPAILCDDIVTCDPAVILSPVARDVADPAPQLSCVRSDGLPITDPFPVGTTTVTCVAVDACGNLSTRPFTVNVRAPIATPGLADQTVLAGSDVLLSIAVSGAGPMSYVWKFNGDVIPGATTALFVLENVLPAASGTYCVEVTGPCNPATNCFTLTVLDLHIEFCTLTQNFYADTNSVFGGVPTLDLLTNLLSAGPLIVGKSGVRSVTVGGDDAEGLLARMPAGGPASALADIGDQFLATLPLNSKQRLDNALLGQTLTLALNCRLDPTLPGFVPGDLICSRGADGVNTFNIPASVLEAMASPAPGVNDPTVAGLLELANRGLAGLLADGPTPNEISQALEALNAAFDGCRTLVTCSPLASLTPVNDNFAARTPVSGDAIVSGRNVAASVEPGEPAHGLATAGRSIWWQWTPTQSGLVRIRTRGSSFDTVLAIYTGDTFGDFTLVAANDDSGSGVWSEVEFEAVAGTPCQIAVDGYARESGTVILTISAVP